MIIDLAILYKYQIKGGYGSDRNKSCKSEFVCNEGNIIGLMRFRDLMI